MSLRSARELMMTSRRGSQARRWIHPKGWLGVGLATLKFAAPRVVKHRGAPDDAGATRNVLAFVGARELVHRAGLLGSRHRVRSTWSRLAGDAVDLGVLAVAMRRRGIRHGALVGATGAVVALTAVDAVAAVRAARSTRRQRMIELTATTTIRRPRADVYAFWRRLENLPTFMAHVAEVVPLDERRSRWQATAPFGRRVSWNAELTHDVPDTRIAWQSTGRAAVPNAGSVTFTTAPDGFSTEVHVRLRYGLPAGRVGAAVARYFGEDPHQQVDDDLRRFKQVMETGEVVRSDGTPRGKRARHEFPQRPAQPLRSDEILEVVVV